MKNKPILLVAGEPNSIFLEIFFKSYKKKFKSPLILISSLKLLNLQMRRLKFKKKIRLINYKKIFDYKFDNNSINLIDVDYKTDKAFNKISQKSNSFIKKSFDVAFYIINSGFSYMFLIWSLKSQGTGGRVCSLMTWTSIRLGLQPFLQAGRSMECSILMKEVPLPIHQGLILKGRINLPMRL